MQPRNFWNIEAVSVPEQKDKQLSGMLRDLYTILSNGIIFQDNLKGAFITVNFTAANTVQSIQHGLAFVPTYYVPVQKSVAMDIYGLNTNFNKQNIYLSSTAVGTVILMVF